MNPDQVNIQLFGNRNQAFLVKFVDSDLRNFHEENVAGMDIDAQIRAGQIFEDFCSHIFSHGAVLTARKYPVHIQVKSRDSPGNRVDAQRIHGRIDVYDAVQIFRMRLNPFVDFITYILPF